MHASSSFAPVLSLLEEEQNEGGGGHVHKVEEQEREFALDGDETGARVSSAEQEHATLDKVLRETEVAMGAKFAAQKALFRVFGMWGARSRVHAWGAFFVCSQWCSL